MTERVTKRGIRDFILICILAMLVGTFVPVGVSAATTYSRTLNSCIVKAKKGRIVLAYNPSQTGVPVYARTSPKSQQYGVLGFGDAVVVNTKKLKMNKKYAWLPVYMDNLKDAKGRKATAYVQMGRLKILSLNAKKYSSNRIIDKAIKTGMKYLGTPFILGGLSMTDGIDCSGFVGKCFQMAGRNLANWYHTITLEGVSRQIFWHNTNTPLTKEELNKMKVGDLLFYLDKDTTGAIGHVGIYIGKRMMLNASGHYGYVYPTGGVCIKRVQYGQRYMVLCKRIIGF